MKKLVLTLLLTIITTNVSASSQTCVPSSKSCEMYLCVEQNMNCGYNGYPLRIGYRFCEIFLNFKPTSKQTNIWLDKVRYCIQEKQKDSHLNQCNQLAAISVQDHLDCYVDNGYCQLTQKDRNVFRKFMLKKFLKAPKFFTMNVKNMLLKGCI